MILRIKLDMVNPSALSIINQLFLIYTPPPLSPPPVFSTLKFCCYLVNKMIKCVISNNNWPSYWDTITSSLNTLKCLSIGTPKTINFLFVSNEKLMVYRCPNIQAHYNEAVIYLNFGTPKNNEFSIWNKWKIYYF